MGTTRNNTNMTPINKDLKDVWLNDHKKKIKVEKEKAKLQVNNEDLKFA